MKKKNYYTQLFSECRRCWSMRNDTRKKALNEVKTKDVEGMDKYTCAVCKKSYARSDIQVDHISAIGKQPTCIESFIESVKSLHSENLQILCTKCHKMKTKQDVSVIKKAEYVKQINIALENLGYPHISTNFYSSLCLSEAKKIKDLIDKVRSNGKNQKRNEDKLLKLLNKI